MQQFTPFQPGQPSTQPLPPQQQWQQPQYPPPVIQPPKPHRRFKKRWIVVAVIVVIIALVAIAGCSNSSSTTSTTPVTQTTHTAQTTTAPTYQTTVQTAIPASAGPALLGSQIGAFVAKYGQPSHAQGGSYTFDNLDIITDNSRAIAILNQAPSNGWNKSTALAACLNFAPTNAVYQRQMTLLDPQGNVQAIQRVYFSPSLAPLLPTNDFTNEHGNPDQPGTFGIVLTPDSIDTGVYDSCSIQSVLQQL